MKTDLRRYRFKYKEQKQRFSLTLTFSLVVFAVLFAAILLGVLILYVLIWTGVIDEMTEEFRLSHVVLFLSAISLLLGGLIAFFASKFPLTPFNDLINRMNRLAAGDFRVRMKPARGFSNYAAFRELTDSFNTLAAELENTEMLRGDFINNFSHEFKTPIVSIAGLAKVLKKGNLTEEERRQYLDAIEEESMRLASMATNVLNLTKVENQQILTDITEYNLSEQIRSAILLLENKWSRKNIELQLDFDEYRIEASEELLKQVWINLIDNAVKFVPRCGTVSVSIREREEHLAISVGNTGSEIPPEKQEKIWNKFYQADESHATEGNGIGLAIVRRIVELHGGAVSVQSGDGMTVFTVELPCRQ